MLSHKKSILLSGSLNSIDSANIFFKKYLNYLNISWSKITFLDFSIVFWITSWFTNIITAFYFFKSGNLCKKLLVLFCSFVNSGSTPNYSFRLANAARQSAPIIIDISEYPENLLTRTNFVEENDRSLNSFYNIEYIEAKNSNNLYLGYKNVYDVSVFDSVTNSFVVENKFSETEKITVSDHATPIILEEGREYKVKYRVRNSYYVDNEDYNNGVIGTKIYFDSTPMYGATPLQGPFTYNVTYESSIFDTATPTGLYHSPIVSLNSEHFVYLTNSNYEYDRFIAQMNPAVISDNRNADYSLLTIESLDKNLNPKPYQTYSISSSNLSATPSTVTTNDEGFAVVELRYKGAYPATVSYDTILISGVASEQKMGVWTSAAHTLGRYGRHGPFEQHQLFPLPGDCSYWLVFLAGLSAFARWRRAGHRQCFL